MNGREDCDDEGNEDDEICSTQRDLEELRRKLKSPDRLKFERELQKINTAIRDLEAKFRSLQSSRTHSSTSNHDGQDRESLMNELRGFKAEREKQIDTRKKIDQELKGVNITVQQKNDACGRLQASLKYKTEARADEAIRRLQHQLRVQQLKLREEKRVVLEIDALKRSKKQIHEFDALKQEISQLRDKQHALRKQRDNCMKEITKLKSKEEEIKTSLDKQRSKDGEVKKKQIDYSIERNSLKREIDELYTRKRSLLSTFHKEKEDYYALLKDIREQEKQIKREEEALRRIEERHQHRQQRINEGSDLHFVNAAHEKMLGVCDSLIVYLNGLNIGNKTDEQQPLPEQETIAQQNIDSEFSGGTLLKKKMDDDLEEMYGAVSGKKWGRKGSKKGKKAAQKENVLKKLILHPLVLDQFISLHITPPSTASDIPKVLGVLVEKKASLYTVIDVPEPLPRSPSTTSSSSSLENFPSLPSQQESLPSQQESLPSQEESSPSQEESFPSQQESFPSQQESLPSQQESLPRQQEPINFHDMNEHDEKTKLESDDGVDNEELYQKKEGRDTDEENQQQETQQQNHDIVGGDEALVLCQKQKEPQQKEQQQQQNDDAIDEELASRLCEKRQLPQQQPRLELQNSAPNEQEYQNATQPQNQRHSTKNTKMKITDPKEDSNISDIIQENSSTHANKNSSEEFEKSSNTCNNGSSFNDEVQEQNIKYASEETGDENIAAGSKDRRLALASTNTKNTSNSSVECPS